MKKLKLSATITIVLGFFSMLALILLFLALSDISKQSEDLTLEWHITGICIVILFVFIFSTFVTLSLLFKSELFWHSELEENSSAA